MAYPNPPDFSAQDPNNRPLMRPQADESHWFKDRFNSDEIDLLAVWNTLWRQKVGIGALIIVVMMLATLIVYSMTPIYQATSSLLIEQRGARVLSIEQVYGMEGSGQEFIQTQVELLQSRGLAERVVRRLNLHTHYEFDASQNPSRLREMRSAITNFSPQRLLPGTVPEDLEERVTQTEAELVTRTARSLLGRVTIEPIRRSQLVLIRVEMADRFTAAEIANAFAEGFIESQLEANLDMSMSATNWMSGRLGSLRENLRASEERLQAFRDEHDLVDIGGILSVSAGELSATSDRMIDARRQRAEAESQFRQVQGIRTEGWERIASVPAVLSDPLVRQFRTEEARSRARVEELSGRYGSRHPAMEAARSDLNSARASLQAQVEQVVASIERNYQLALANERALMEAVETNREEIQELSRREFELRELQREVQTNRALYDTFLTRLQETSATADLETANARIIDRANVPSSPIKPRKGLIIVLSGLLAGMFGAGVALLLAALNNTFRGSEEVEEKLNLPVLGIVPTLGEKERGEMVHMFHSEEHKTFAESIRTIRTSIMLSSVERKQQVILVTSSVPGEGKSSVAANMAYAMGQMESVVLVEADMRRPGIGKAFDLPAGTPGLANLIHGTVGLEDAVHEIDGLNVINAGTVPPNPLELLSTERFSQVLKALCERFDRVIIDSPPVQAVSDALVLARHSHSVIYVIRSDHTARNLAVRGVGQLLQAGAPMTGVVLNRVDIKKAQKYGYSYGGYYDYYGYSSGDGKTTTA